MTPVKLKSCHSCLSTYLHFFLTGLVLRVANQYFVHIFFREMGAKLYCGTPTFWIKMALGLLFPNLNENRVFHLYDSLFIKTSHTIV